ncbi:hypothetical protein SKAU_G00169980 [Synaphobranchus kaupii]|uniref:Uncharacterized protein n=1 Tax=Synaphobranchus kaupii TaxID=118154 RepID=A0A9Q1FK60_SYNKA|nr:hypothetical protein SKAU_G00169980 [Synaphobranchus kaupii]
MQLQQHGPWCARRPCVDEDSASWRLPEVTMQKTALPAAVPPSSSTSQGGVPARRSSAVDCSDSLEEDRYKEMLNRSDSEHIASNYFKSKRANQLLTSDPKRNLAPHMVPPISTGAPVLTSSSSNFTIPSTESSPAPPLSPGVPGCPRSRC